MTSKIINMADRLKDEADLKLEALFSTEQVQDGGFSGRVISRVRRRMWVERLSLPTAIVIGGIIAAKPLLQLAELMPKIAGAIPQDLANLVDLPLHGMPQVSTVVLGVMLLAAMLMMGKMLED